MTTAGQIPCVEINLPELFARQDFQAWLNNPDTVVASWHRKGQAPDEMSDVFLTYDNGEGSNSDMPGWDLVCTAMKKAGLRHSLVRLTNLDEGE